MSYFAVLALTCSSKVLKGNDLLFVSSMVLKETFGATFINGLERSCLTDFMFHVLEGNLFPPRLTHGEVSVPLFLTVSLTLLALSFSLMTLMPSTLMILKEVDFCLALSCLCIFGWDLEGSFSVCAPSHGLERTDGWS